MPHCKRVCKGQTQRVPPTHTPTNQTHLLCRRPIQSACFRTKCNALQRPTARATNRHPNSNLNHVRATPPTKTAADLQARKRASLTHPLVYPALQRECTRAKLTRHDAHTAPQRLLTHSQSPLAHRLQQKTNNLQLQLVALPDPPATQHHSLNNATDSQTPPPLLHSNSSRTACSTTKSPNLHIHIILHTLINCAHVRPMLRYTTQQTEQPVAPSPTPEHLAL